LLGPLGTGILYVRKMLTDQLRPLLQGGTGTESQTEEQPEAMPEKFEAGNLNVPALAGLAAAAESLQSETHKKLGQRTQQLLEGLLSIRGVRLVGPGIAPPRTSVVSFDVDGYDPQEFAAGLDATSGVECRAGLHCAPRMHAALGTDRSGGLVRLSPGWATTSKEIDQALAAIEALAAQPLR
ncbi:MAG: aminotransferase class V-fold PLP-dependent enzyme, partial [Planctomycetes bacterium]|nr:aminotransferase class V-fold PLP-dependent enzyme [Planctomycetota bacterium]